MIRYYLFLSFIIYFGASYGQTCTLKGKVYDGQIPLPFCAVAFQEMPGKGTSTNSNGEFTLNEIPEGDYHLILSLVGYEKKTVPVKVNSNNQPLEITLKEAGYGLREVVVTGTMKETFIEESPVKVEVITGKYLQKLPTNNIMEVIQSVNGVQEQINCGVCNTSDIHINGMEGPYTLVLIDGMPIMSALSTVYGLNGIPTSIIDRIEIIKGPSSTLYGTEAVAGVINVITKKPDQVPLISINGFATSHLEKNLDIAIAPKKEKYSMLFSGNLYHMDHRIDENNDGFTDVALSKRISLFNKTSFHRKENRILNLSAKAYYEDRFGGQTGWTPEFRGSDLVYGESIYTSRAELIGNYQLPFKEKIMLDFSFNTHHQNSYYGTTLYKAEQSTAFSNLTYNKQLGKHDLLSGLTFRMNNYNDNTPATPQSDLRIIPGVFLQDEMLINPKVTLLSGARLDHHKNHGFIFSPRVNVKYKPFQYTTFRLNSGSGFRVVNLFTEDHAALTGSRTVVIKNKLSPEESYNVSLNTNHIFVLGNSTSTIDADIFYTYFKNKIIPDYLSDPNLIIYDNLKGYSVSRGISISASQSFKFPLRLSAGTTFLDVYSIQHPTELATVKQPELFAPKWSTVLSVNYSIKKWNTSIDYLAKFTGPMALPEYPEPFSRPTTSTTFANHNIQVNHKISRVWQLYWGAKNIFDYTQPSPLIDPANPFGPDFDTSYAYGPLQGRRFFVGFRANIK